VTAILERLSGKIDLRRLVLTLISRGLSTIFSFALIISLARVLTAEEYGLYALLFSLASAIGLVLTAGQPMLVVKHFHRQDRPGDRNNQRLIAHNLLWQSTAIGIVWLLGFLCWAFGLGGFSPEAILVILMFASIFLLGEYFQSYFRARNQLKLALVPRENFWRPFATCVIWLTAFLGMSLGGTEALALVGACLALAVGIQAVFFIRDAASRYSEAAPHLEAPPRGTGWTRESVYFALNGLMTAVALHIEVILVGLVLGLEEVALFFVLFRLAMLLNLPQMSMETFALPMVAERLREGDHHGAQQHLSAFALITFLLSLIGAAILVPLSPFIVWIFNPDFEVSRLLMLAIAGQPVVQAYFGLGTGTLMISGGERFFLIYRSALYVLYAGALVLFGLLFGLMGVALTMTGLILIEHLFAASWCARNAKISISAGSALKLFLSKSK